MKYNKIFPVATLALSLLASSCIDMEDNINPNGVTEDMMKVDNLKTGAFIQQMQTRVILVALGGKLSSDYQISRNLSTTSLQDMPARHSVRSKPTSGM